MRYRTGLSELESREAAGNLFLFDLGLLGTGLLAQTSLSAGFEAEERAGQTGHLSVLTNETHPALTFTLASSIDISTPEDNQENDSQSAAASSATDLLFAREEPVSADWLADFDDPLGEPGFVNPTPVSAGGSSGGTSMPESASIPQVGAGSGNASGPVTTSGGAAGGGGQNSAAPPTADFGPAPGDSGGSLITPFDGGSNSPPQANDDSFSVVHDQTLVNYVLTNDSDPDQDPITVVSNTNPSHGAVSVSSSGQVIYTPDTGFVGADSFSYTITDGSAFDSANVLISVTNENPIAVDDSFTSGHDQLIIGYLLDNDTDGDEDSLTVVDHSNPAHGVVTVESSGSFNYTPVGGYVGADQFSYTISDGVATSSATVTLTLTNEAPEVTLTEPEPVSVAEPMTLFGSFTDPNDTIYDSPYTLTVHWGDGGTEQHTIASPSAFEYEHTYAAIGFYNITVEVEDALGAVGTATVQARVATVQTVEWVAVHSPLDANPGNGTPGPVTAVGLRIFPDKITPTDVLDRRKVEIRATVNPAIAGVKVYFAAVDVDDPSDNTSPVDQETEDGNEIPDNRGDSELPTFGAWTDANGVARVQFDVSRQPGDNWRAVASCRLGDLGGIRGKQNDALELRVVDGNGNFLPTATARVSEVLTVWRRLHVEVDSMGLVEGNEVTGVIIDVDSHPDLPNASIVTVSSGSVFTEPADLNRFVGGVLYDFFGAGFRVIASDLSDPEGNFVLYVRNNPDTGAVPSLGNFGLIDDDFLKDGDDVPMPDTSTLNQALNEAYVQVFFDVGGTNDNVPFMANAEEADLELDWNSRSLNANDYWVTYLLGAFQGSTQVDTDPNTEVALLGQSGDLTGGSWTYAETIRDAAVTMNVNQDLLARETVVHEIGHAVTHESSHPVTGINAKLMTLPIGHVLEVDGSVVTHHDWSRFLPRYIARIRFVFHPFS
ncbi:MAG: Ig-like domain-containing protein [Gemmataceae bacterium]|nr:Ig-like domain-containing protein [Gemmataceae bacterium]